jgi:EAL domain-containing protein (putative c-di-GMP-specific phosphodiesterase class I)
MEEKKLILIIDDEPDFVRTMQIFLENAGFKIESAYSGSEGLNKISSLHPDLVLLDLNLPDMKGHQVCRYIKQNSQTYAIPIIMLTCQDTTLDKIEAFDLGVEDYISKTSALEEILARIRSKLSKTIEISNQQRLEKIMELRQIIEERKLRALFQPIISLSNQNILGYEAFTRGPENSELEDPLRLFSLAQKENMFSQLDRIVMETIIKKAEKFLQDKLLFLNVNPLFIEFDYFKSVNFLKGSFIKPQQLCIEITERAWITDFSKLSNILWDFKKRGIQIAIDDVGEGYASLKAIAELKPEFIKIDISLIRDIDKDETKITLVGLIVNLAKKLNNLTIAEGVEKEEEKNTLLSLGVDYAQGYLFSRPKEEF